jgi:hypothetical protein
MNSQSTSLPAIPQLPPEPGQKMVPAAETTIPLQAPAKTNLIRRALLAGAAAALLVTASWYGWDYWTVGRFLVSTDDAYVKADNTTIAPKVSCWHGSTTATSRSRSIRPGPMSPRRRPPSRASARNLTCSRL